MFKHIESVIFFVSEIEQAAEWYAELLNSQVEYENPHYAFVRCAGMTVGFHPADAKNSTGVNGSVTYWKVDNVEEAISELTEKGAKLYRGPIKTSLSADVAMLIDPFGNAIGVHNSPMA